MCNVIGVNTCLFVFISENDAKQYADDQSIACKNHPNGCPVTAYQASAFGIYRKGVHYGAAGISSDEGSEAIGHHEEQALCAGPDIGVSLHFSVQRAGYVEEIECHAINNHRKDEHPQSVTGIAQAKQPEAEYPCKHADEHDFLDSEVF